MILHNVVLHYAIIDARSRFVRAYMGYKGIDYALKEYQNPRQDAEVFKRNPSRKLPILECDEGTMCGALPIIETIEESFNTGPLFGETAQVRAESRRLIDWFFHKFEPEVYTPIMDVKYYRSMDNPLEKLKTARKNASIHFKYLEWLMASTTYLVTDRLGVADFCAGAYISSLDYYEEIPWEHYLIMKDWYCKIKGHPSFYPNLQKSLTTAFPPPYYRDVDF